jgi:hypothetical protein
VSDDLITPSSQLLAGNLFFAIQCLMPWTVETLNATVDAEIAALPSDMQARYLRFADTIERVGFGGLPRDAVKHLEDKLWGCASPGGTEFPAPSM